MAPSEKPDAQTIKAISIEIPTTSYPSRAITLDPLESDHRPHIHSEEETLTASSNTADSLTADQQNKMLDRTLAKPRPRPVTVGKAKQLPPPPDGVDLSKDDRFLRRYWIDSEPAKLPRSQERFLFFYFFLYRRASENNCARVLCTNAMASELFGKKAKATLTNYRQIGEGYGLFKTHLITNFERKPGEEAGTYFFLTSPWVNE